MPPRTPLPSSERSAPLASAHATWLAPALHGLALALMLGVALGGPCGCGGSEAKGSGSPSEGADPSAGSDSSSDDLARPLELQSVAHVALRPGSTAHFTFAATSGDDLALDAWPEPKPDAAHASGQQPSLALYRVGARAKTLVAAGTAPPEDPSHPQLELRVTASGSYLVELSFPPTAARGTAKPALTFALRSWSSASHAPRVEAMQISLDLRPDSSAQQLIDTHAPGGALFGIPWTDAEIAALVARITQVADSVVALSSLERAWSTMQTEQLSRLATNAQVAAIAAAGTQRFGSRRSFEALSPAARSFALYWLGSLNPLLLGSAAAAELAIPSPARAAIAEQIGALISAWPRAVEEPAGRSLAGLEREGAIYGYVATWAANQLDTDGRTLVFATTATEFFDADGRWLGEWSYGATEPDDGD